MSISATGSIPLFFVPKPCKGSVIRRLIVKLVFSYGFLYNAAVVAYTDNTVVVVVLSLEAYTCSFLEINLFIALFAYFYFSICTQNCSAEYALWGKYEIIIQFTIVSTSPLHYAFSKFFSKSEFLLVSRSFIIIP